MRIDRIEASRNLHPLAARFRRQHVSRHARVHGGHAGLRRRSRREVYNGDNRDHGPAIVRLIRELLAPLVVGRTRLRANASGTLFAQTIAVGDRKVLLEAIACVDCALWDLMGKATGKTRERAARRISQRPPDHLHRGYYVDGKDARRLRP
jgi:D-arabinonate dehydratase